MLCQALTHQQWLGKQMPLLGKVMLASAVFLDAFRFACFQGHVASLAFEVHVMLHATEDELYIF